MNETTLRHPTLHYTLRGHSLSTTTQFRNIKYASIPSRWQDSILNNSLVTDSNKVFDATTFGPSCPHKRGAQAWDLTLVGDVKMLPGEGDQGFEEQMNEFECLTVNVTVPKSAVKGDVKGLPVFVWVHGGGLSMGSNNWPQYDISKFVERSVAIGKPVIGVAINYRVGVLGFLASEELGSEGNFGFKDQVLAFRWIKKHIAGFGGDAENLTAVGESAGAISLSVLLCAEEKELFKRVVIMSGEALLRKPRNRAWHEEFYRDQLKFWGIEGLSVEKRVKKLRESDVYELVEKLPLAQYFCACVDGKFLKEDLKYSTMSDGKSRHHKPDWCRELVIGDTVHDGTVLKTRILDNPNALSLLKSICDKHLTPSETLSLLAAYNIPTSTPERLEHNLLELASELRFYLPTLAVQSGWKSSVVPRSCCRYHFHVVNRVPGAFTGLGSHEFDVACLLYNYEDFLDETTKAVAKQMMDKWIRFVNGEGWCKENNVIVVDGDGIKEIDEAEYDMKFRGGRRKVLESIGADRLWTIAEAWQGVRSEESLMIVKPKM